MQRIEGTQPTPPELTIPKPLCTNHTPVAQPANQEGTKWEIVDRCYCNCKKPEPEQEYPNIILGEN